MVARSGVALQQRCLEGGVKGKLGGVQFMGRLLPGQDLRKSEGMVGAARTQLLMSV